MVHSICQELLTQMGVINKSKSLLKGIHGNEETASKTIQKIRANLWDNAVSFLKKLLTSSKNVMISVFVSTDDVLKVD